MNKKTRVFHLKDISFIESLQLRRQTSVIFDLCYVLLKWADISRRKKYFMKTVKLTLALLTALSVPAPAFAAILGTTGITQVAAPTDSTYTEADTLQVFQEQSNLTLSNSLSLDSGTLAAGTKVNSYSIYLNPATPNTWTTASGSLTFDSDILGFAWSRNKLEQSDSVLGVSNFSYGSVGNWRGLEGVKGTKSDDLTGIREFAFGAGNNTLNLKFNTWGNGFDELRVLTAGTPTAGAPEPITMLGAGTALGFGALFRKKLAKNKQK
jgi:hypothetical protein